MAEPKSHRTPQEAQWRTLLSSVEDALHRLDIAESIADWHDDPAWRLAIVKLRAARDEVDRARDGVIMCAKERAKTDPTFRISRVMR